MLRDFRPGEVWEGVRVDGHAETTRLRGEAARRRMRWRIVQTGEGEADDDDIDIRVWHPSAPERMRTRVRNDDSIVLELALGDVSLVLPGDIGPAVERVLAAHASRTPLFRASRDSELPGPAVPGPAPPGAAIAPPRCHDSERGHARNAAGCSPGPAEPRLVERRPVERRPVQAHRQLRGLKVPHHGSRTSSDRGLSRRAPAASGHRQRRTWQPARPSRAGRARTIRGAWNGGVQDGSGRRDSARYRRPHVDPANVLRPPTDAPTRPLGAIDAARRRLEDERYAVG